MGPAYLILLVLSFRSTTDARSKLSGARPVRVHTRFLAPVVGKTTQLAMVSCAELSKLPNPSLDDVLGAGSNGSAALDNTPRGEKLLDRGPHRSFPETMNTTR